MSSHSSDPHHTTQASIESSADALMRLFDDASSSRRESGLSGTFRPQNIAYAEEQASSVLAFHWRGRTPRLQATAPEEGCFVAADCQRMQDLHLPSLLIIAAPQCHAQTPPR